MKRVVLAAALAALSLASCKGASHPTHVGAAATSTSSTLDNPGPGGDAGGSPTTSAGGNPTTNATRGLATPAGGQTPSASNQLAMPKPGGYTFREVTTTNGKSTEDELHYVLSVDGQNVRTQQQGDPPSNYFEEAHRPDGMFLTRSVLSGGTCEWTPPAASLPQSVIDGGTASTHSTCSVTVKGVQFTFDLALTLTYKATRECDVSGVHAQCVDVTRHRVLKSGDTTETVEAVDTFALNLGLRTELSEQVTHKDRSGTVQHTHRAVLVGLPS